MEFKNEGEIIKYINIKWNFLKDIEYLYELLKEGIDLIIFGQINSGKTELINDLTITYDIKIKLSLLYNYNYQSILVDICDRIISFTNKKHKIKNYISFLDMFRSDNLLNINDCDMLKLQQFKIIIIFDDCQLYESNNKKNQTIANLYEILIEFRRIINLNIQYVFLSKRNIKIDIYKFYLHFPEIDDIIQLLYTNILDNLNNENNKLNIVNPKNTIFLFINKLVKSFYIITNNINTMKLILNAACELFKHLIRNDPKYNILTEDNILYPFNSREFKVFFNYFFYNPKNCMKPINIILNEIIEISNKSILEKNIDLNTIQKNRINDFDINSLPLLSAIILISLFIGSKINYKNDKMIFSEIKKGRKGKKNNIIKESGSSYVSLNRIISIAQTFMQKYIHINEEDTKINFDIIRLTDEWKHGFYASSEFMCNFKLLEKVRLIEKSTAFMDETSNVKYQYIGDFYLIQAISEKLDANIEHYI